MYDSTLAVGSNEWKWRLLRFEKTRRCMDTGTENTAVRALYRAQKLTVTVAIRGEIITSLVTYGRNSTEWICLRYLK